MKPIIEPVDRSVLKAELNEERLLRTTNRAGNELYIVGPEAVNVIREIGRLREIAFRNDGGGTGEALDIDKFDTDPSYGYKQLVLWDPETEEIIGGYRFCLCDEAVFDRFGQPILTSTHMFEFSKKYLKEQFDKPWNWAARSFPWSIRVPRPEPRAFTRWTTFLTGSAPSVSCTRTGSSTSLGK